MLNYQFKKNILKRLSNIKKKYCSNHLYQKFYVN